MSRKKWILLAVLLLSAAAITGGVLGFFFSKGIPGNKTALSHSEENAASSESSADQSVAGSALDESTASVSASVMEPTPEVTPEATPEPLTAEPIEGAEEQPESAEEPADGNGHIVVLDPGHQGHGDSTKEPVGPGSQQTKARVTSGTSGAASGLDEYELNLQVSLLLRTELEKRGYTVYLTRETADVNISNKERAEYATSVGGEILVRIHANGSENSAVHGALCMAPSDGNGYVAALAPECTRLAQSILDSYCAKTGFRSQGVYITDEMSGINWSTMPVTIVEMGYMTNQEEDLKMADSSFQQVMAEGMADGIDAYFS